MRAARPTLTLPSRAARASPDRTSAKAAAIRPAIGNQAHLARLTTGAPTRLQRTVEFRDVGRGDASGFARLPELIDRLNAASQGLDYSAPGGVLTATPRPGGTLSNFDTQLQGFIGGPVIPLRLTNRHGLLGDRAHGFNAHVEGDDWGSGYVDIDDLLASSPLGMQVALIHILAERAATPNYAHRMGSGFMESNLPARNAEFNRRHGSGVAAEVPLLRDFFGDPTIERFDDIGEGQIFRRYRNSRHDIIRMRVTPGTGAAGAGIDAVSIEVRTHDGVRHTAEEYRDILRAAAPPPAAPAPAAAPAAP